MTLLLFDMFEINFLELVQFSSVPIATGPNGDMKDKSAEIFFRSFLQEALVRSSGMGKDVHSLMLSSSISSADSGVTHLPRCPEGWFSSEAVVACDMSEPCKFPSLGSCQWRFLWANMKLILLRTQEVGLVRQEKKMLRSFLMFHSHAAEWR